MPTGNFIKNFDKLEKIIHTIHNEKSVSNILFFNKKNDNLDELIFFLRLKDNCGSTNSYYRLKKVNEYLKKDNSYLKFLILKEINENKRDIFFGNIDAIDDDNIESIISISELYLSLSEQTKNSIERNENFKFCS